MHGVRSLKEFFDGRARLIELPVQAEARGSLIPFDFDQLPFSPRHAFTVQGVPAGSIRGEHAHRSSHQLVICLAGKLGVELWDSGKSETVYLDRPDVGLLITENLWASQTYSGPETIMLVFASERYDPDDLVGNPGNPKTRIS